MKDGEDLCDCYFDNRSRYEREDWDGYFEKNNHPLQTGLELSLVSISVIGNGLICFSFFYLKKPIPFYAQLCVSLALIDIWTSSLFGIHEIVYRFFLREMYYLSNDSVCPLILIISLRAAASVSSSWHLLALAIYQYIGILWPLRTKTDIRRRHIRGLFVFLWTIPMLSVLIMYFIYPNEGFRHWDCLRPSLQTFHHRLYFFMLIFIPISLTTIIYIRLVFYLRFPYNATNVYGVKRLSSSSFESRENNSKLVITSIVIVATFVIGIGCQSIESILVCDYGCPMRIGGQRWTLWLHYIGDLLIMIKFCLNPLIYTIRMKCFRVGLSGMAQSCNQSFGKMKGYMSVSK